MKKDALHLTAELEILNELLFKPSGFHVNNVVQHPESKEYQAHSFQLNELNIEFRCAKITPTKIGQFVTLWKRNGVGVTAPFSHSDAIDYYMIFTRKDAKLGVFVFPKNALLQHGVIADATSVGKRGIRVYPSWDETTNAQAKKTQSWQLRYFVELTENASPAKDHALKWFVENCCAE